MRLRLAFLLASLPCLACSERPAIVKEGYSALVPPDAVALVHLQSFRALADESGSFERLAFPRNDPASALERAEDLRIRLDCPVPAEEMDLDLPCALAVSLDPNRPEPSLTFILPARDPEAMAETMRRRGDGWSATVLGGYVALARNPPEPLAGAATGRLRDAPPGLLTARVDFAALMRVYQPILEIGITAVERQITREDAAAGAAVSLYMDWLRNLIRSMDLCEAAWTAENGEWALELGTSFRAGSPLALAPGAACDYRKLALQLDAEAQVQVMAKFGGASMQEAVLRYFRSLMDAQVAAGGVTSEEVEAVLSSQSKLWSLFGREAAACMSGELGESGHRSASFLSCADPDAVIAEWIEGVRTLSLPAAGMSAGAVEDATIAGRPAKSWRMALDLDRFYRFTQPEVRKDPGFEALTQSLSRILAPDGAIHVSLIPMDGGVLLLQNGDAAWREAAVRRAADPEPPGALPEELLARMDGAEQLLWMRMDVRSVMSDVNGALQRSAPDPGAASAVRHALEKLGGGELPFSILWTRRPEGMNLRASMDRAGAARCVAALNALE
jgi:hypothetical protein